jgi:RimJ/RimL family protein N-acetyltransferase
MHTTNVLSEIIASMSRSDSGVSDASSSPRRNPAILVQRLTAAALPALRAHFLALGPEDVRLRFGGPLRSEAILRYLDQIDFEVDAVFGVYDDALKLIAVTHVAFTDDTAELGVSVLPGHRGKGLGTALFTRAVDHVRNRFFSRLFMHCLAENSAMMHIARKSGMKICVETGEAEAFLRLPPADQASVTGEFVDQRLALFDYALKSRMAALRRATEVLAPPVTGGA